jgi:hypothetical protein
MLQSTKRHYLITLITSVIFIASLTSGRVVSRRLAIAAARVRSLNKSCGICGGQSGTGAGYLRVLRFPLPIIYSTNCSKITIIYHSVLVQ